MGDEESRKAERRKILERLASYEGEGLSPEEAQRLEQLEQENEHQRRLELEKGKRTAGS